MLMLGKASYWQKVNPTGALADFAQVWRAAGRRRWMFILLAGMMTYGVFSIMSQESWKAPPRRPQVTFIKTWAPDRTDAEIIRTNIANQRLQERLRAEQAARDEKVKDIYRSIGRASGMDVDAIEREAKAQEAAEKAAEQKSIGRAPIASATAAPDAEGAAPVGPR
ncbi:MAG: hypothetical protein V4579_02815 [Pseudomonadota bacterium]